MNVEFDFDVSGIPKIACFIKRETTLKHFLNHISYAVTEFRK